MMILIPLAAFMNLSYEEIDYDYSFYLGKDYKKTRNKAPTVVSNHQAWIDNMILECSPIPVAFAAKVETKKVWILHSMIKFTQGIWITRGGSTKEERDAQIHGIIARQEKVEKDPRWNPICIYPEGTQSNGSALLQFKRGAFVSMKAVTPVVVKYSWG
jgi:1-acyl-sn-glycerol-3-phosphate acyltransferase